MKCSKQYRYYTAEGRLNEKELEHCENGLVLQSVRGVFVNCISIDPCG